MTDKNVLDYTEAVHVTVARKNLTEAIEHRIRNELLPEINAIKVRLEKLIKNRENGLQILMALRRDPSEFSENTMLVDACLTRIRAMEIQVEELNRVATTLPSGEMHIRITMEQVKYYGIGNKL